MQNSAETESSESESESEAESEPEVRRPGERGKSAIKEIPDDAEDNANSPIEGYILLLNGSPRATQRGLGSSGYRCFCYFR